MYTIKILKEDEIPWELQNEIHRLLNITFKNKSKKFIAKTYANVRPTERIIYFEDEKPIAHLGIYKDTVHIGNFSHEVTCLGLWCSVSHSKRLATDIMRTAYEYLRAQGVTLGIGVTNSKVVLKYILPELTEFKHAQLDINIQGKTTSSKPTDKVLLFAINMGDEEFGEIKKAAISAGTVYVDTEIF